MDSVMMIRVVAAVVAVIVLAVIIARRNRSASAVRENSQPLAVVVEWRP